MVTTPLAAMTRLQRPLARRQHATGHLCSFSPASFTSTRSGEQWAQDTSASARHRHAVDRGEIVDGERVRQLEESYAVAILGHVAASHGQQRPSRLGGGGDESPAQAVVRGGGHEPARSADKSRPAVTRRHAEPCAVRRAGRVECAVGAQGAEEPAMARAETLPRVCHCGARAECTFPQGIFNLNQVRRCAGTGGVGSPTGP